MPYLFEMEDNCVNFPSKGWGGLIDNTEARLVPGIVQLFTTPQSKNLEKPNRKQKKWRQTQKNGDEAQTYISKGCFGNLQHLSIIAKPL